MFRTAPFVDQVDMPSGPFRSTSHADAELVVLAFLMDYLLSSIQASILASVTRIRTDTTACL